MAEAAALQAVRRQELGSGFDGVLLVPAFLEARRLTAADIHRACIGPDLVPAGQTEFAQDPLSGYTASDLKDFISCKSGGTTRRGDLAITGLADIRPGGPSGSVTCWPAQVTGMWVAVNATKYSDLETVGCGVLLAERVSQSFPFRTGPSFVRALAGLAPMPPLRGREIWPHPGRAGHGLIVAGSYASQISSPGSARHHRYRT
jgi:uncharacterized protein YgbK (DUF1537 family)